MGAIGASCPSGLTSTCAAMSRRTGREPRSPARQRGGLDLSGPRWLPRLRLGDQSGRYSPAQVRQGVDIRGDVREVATSAYPGTAWAGAKPNASLERVPGVLAAGSGT